MKTQHYATTAGAENPRILALKAGELILKSVGENQQREGLIKTPARFAKALDELCSGYHMTAQDAIGEGVFAAEGSGLVSINNIEFYSLCEHHMLPFWGHMSLAYYPDKHIVGLSKIPRLVEIFSRRLQVQERLTHEVAHALFDIIKPKAVFVQASAQHMCMMMRGVRKQSSDTLSEFSLGEENLNELQIQRAWQAVSYRSRS